MAGHVTSSWLLNADMNMMFFVCVFLLHRLNEDTFTLDEVTDMIDGLLTVVRGEVC